MDHDARRVATRHGRAAEHRDRILVEGFERFVEKVVED
jgi:hypothetical protein